MVLRKLTLALLGMGVMLPGLSHALAVRDIQTKSALGQPLRVEVELSDLGDLTSEDIKVTLATQEDFARLGIERDFFLTDLRFEVVVNASGRSYIRVNSSKRVIEPFLDFIIRITWPGNMRLQELPILLDPPTMAQSKPTAVEAPVVAAPLVVVPEVVTAAPVAEVAEVSATDSEKTYQVRRRDNLWSIAQRVRPGAHVSVPRMVQALFKANPQAFVANNINHLRSGEVLRVPTLDAVQSGGEARTALSSPVPSTPSGEERKLTRRQINAATASPQIQAAVVPRAEMRLVAPVGGKTAMAGRKADPKGTAANRDEKTASPAVTVNRKAVPVRPVANPGVLATEVSALEHKLKTNDKTIAMQNARLARLEAQLKALAAQEQQAKQKPSDKKGLERKAIATLACGVATQSFLSTEAKAADAPAKAEGGSMMPLVAGVVVLLLVVGAIIALKGKSKKETPAAPQPKPSAPPKPVEPPAAAKPAAPAPAPQEVKKPTDPAEEARAYLNLERYPQAVGVLNKALAQSPDRTDLHLMLLEIFAKQQDRSSFEEQYQRLEALGELEAIMKADELKALLPQPQKAAPARDASDGIDFVRPVVKEETVDAGPSLEDLEKDFALSLSQPNLKALDIEIRETPSISAAAEAAKVEEIDRMLDQGLDFSFSQPTEPAPVPEVALEQPAALDFSFEAPAAPAPVEEKAPVEELSLDSLDAFLAEQTAAVESKPVETPAVEAPAAFDFDKALADYKEEAGEPVAEESLNLAEGLELEEFNVSQINIPAADVPLRTETQTGLEALEGDFNLDDFAKTPEIPVEEPAPALVERDGGLDLGSAAAAFDAELAGGADLSLDDGGGFESVDAGDSGDVLDSLDKEFAFLATTDENTTRLDLARAYVEMGDKMAARDLLEEVIADGKEDQKTEAQGMLMRIG